MSDKYSMYKCFKGEKENPFDNDKQNAQHMFWFYESVFDQQFTEKESSEWYSFFDEHDLADEFLSILREGDRERPSENKKKPVFELWLVYLFKFKLYPEYGGENTDKKLYDSIGL